MQQFNAMSTAHPVGPQPKPVQDQAVPSVPSVPQGQDADMGISTVHQAPSAPALDPVTVVPTVMPSTAPTVDTPPESPPESSPPPASAMGDMSAATDLGSQATMMPQAEPVAESQPAADQVSLAEEPVIERVVPTEPEPVEEDVPVSQQTELPEEVVISAAKSVEDVLSQQGVITQEQLSQLQTEAISHDKNILTLLQEKGLVTEQQLAKAKAIYYNVPYIDLLELGTSPEAMGIIDQGTAQRYRLLPFGVDKDKKLISVAMANPLDLNAIDFVEKKTGYRIKPHMAVESTLIDSIPERYAQSLSSEVTAALKESSNERKKVVDVTRLGEVIREAPIAKIVETILTYAIKGAASDIHIEPQEDKTRVRYRIDGILHEKLVLPRGVHDAVVSRIKILADLKIDEKRLPQDGRFTFAMGAQEVDLRVSTLPTVNGEKVVMRLLKKTASVPTLQDLGLKGLALKNLEASIVVPHGIILITGPTGSGKTTTLYAILSRINTPKVNIVTLEDPVEYEIPGVNQVQINPKAGLTFASGLRSFLRQDPNIIQVGEIRDEETAELAIQASLTGHLVFSTLHTNSAAGAIPRLMDMKAEPFLLASSMTCVVGQRVVRKICEHCKQSVKPEQAVIDDIKSVLGPLFDSWATQKGIAPDQLELHKGEGCSECNDTGYSGRVAIFEVLPVNEKIAKLIIEHAPASKIEDQAMTDGMILMKMDGYLKVLEGITTIEEVLRVAEI